MNHKIKILGLAIASLFAVTAVITPAAQAQFTSDAAQTTLSGSSISDHTYTAGTGIGAIKCTHVDVKGTVSGISVHTWALTPTYTGCKDSLGRTVDITKNNLLYTFTSGATAGETKGNINILGEIVFTVTGAFGHCRITVKGAQTWNGASYTNEAGIVKITTNTNNIHSEISGGPFPCGTSSTTSTTGTYTGTTLMFGNGGVASVSVH